MKGPITLVRSGKIEGMKNHGPLYEWSEGTAYLVIEKVSYKGVKGAILCYYNPPVHQVGNPALDAHLEGLDSVYTGMGELKFLILYGANDPVHAGGDLKESLDKLDRTLAMKKEREQGDTPPQEIDQLYDWADNRLRKGVSLHGVVRKIARHLRVVAVCGGGTRFGGSAEVPLMADYLVGDSRSGMCFSEVMIGLLPGWSGVARAIVKSGPINAQYMALTGREVKADKLKMCGIYNAVVDISLAFPKMQKTADPKTDKALYAEALEKHDQETGIRLLPKGLEMAICPEQEIPVLRNPPQIVSEAEIDREVNGRVNPLNYSHLWGKTLKEAGEEIARAGRPLAPQSVEALRSLFEGVEPASFDESVFVRREMEADARLYRDKKFRAGLVATLEQKVADYREASV
jgi:enoyl-CoA hydratase/carnithine racemase